MQALLTVHTTAGIGGEQCLREAALLRRLWKALNEKGVRMDEALDSADEWQRLGELCLKSESSEQVTI